MSELTREGVRELSGILGTRAATTLNLAQAVLEEHRRAEQLSEALLVAHQRCENLQRDLTALKQKTSSVTKLEAAYEAKAAALEFAVRRNEVLRRQLSEALGGSSRTASVLKHREVLSTCLTTS